MTEVNAIIDKLVASGVPIEKAAELAADLMSKEAAAPVEAPVVEEGGGVLDFEEPSVPTRREKPKLKPIKVGEGGTHDPDDPDEGDEESEEEREEEESGEDEEEATPAVSAAIAAKAGKAAEFRVVLASGDSYFVNAPDAGAAALAVLEDLGHRITVSSSASVVLGKAAGAKSTTRAAARAEEEKAKEEEAEELGVL